jgi:hypothetical protein
MIILYIYIELWLKLLLKIKSLTNQMFIKQVYYGTDMYINKLLHNIDVVYYE